MEFSTKFGRICFTARFLWGRKEIMSRQTFKSMVGCLVFHVDGWKTCQLTGYAMSVWSKHFMGRLTNEATNSSISGFDEARKFLRKHGAIYPGVPWQHLWMFHWEFAESNYSPEIGNPKTTGRWWINFSCIKLVWLDFDQLFFRGVGLLWMFLLCVLVWSGTFPRDTKVPKLEDLFCELQCLRFAQKKIHDAMRTTPESLTPAGPTGG